MCQDLVLGWFDFLFAMCGAKTETLAKVREFTFLLEHQKFLKFLHSTDMQGFIFTNFLEFLELQKYTKFPDYYKLSCF